MPLSLELIQLLGEVDDKFCGLVGWECGLREQALVLPDTVSTGRLNTQSRARCQIWIWEDCVTRDGQIVIR
ncbi:predicted protein [Plenodomus lingam JN3]|uniref:Predicted protein n=1 Tax=Leptosphaeria maculans (strain JN3 / isolate v23.1.3 / race Av1-4-5-6-7-8) TaxID=985895 RepID=E5ABG5_LEPMJ|nr:predicted protein [Plenodomus lingam JN3]CBY01006.1 predicted protein [Plenodomus lingam JN3]